MLQKRLFGVGTIIGINHNYNYYKQYHHYQQYNNNIVYNKYNTLSTYCDTSSLSSSFSSSSIVLYQYRICPFCHRVRSLLDYLHVNSKTLEVDPLTKTELSFSKDYKKVPVAIIQDNIIGDSGKIIK